MATFTSLPAEMRNAIYNELLANAVTKAGRSQSKLGLLAASKLIHEEATSYFYQHNTFTIDLPAAIDDWDTMPHEETVLPPIPDRCLKYIKHLTINICATGPRVPEYAQRLAGLASSGATLSTLTLCFSSNASRIMSSRVDDCILDASHSLTVALSHILSSNIAQAVRIQLDNVWFTPVLATQLQTVFGERLEFLTPAPSSSFERTLTGQMMQTYLHALGLEVQDIADAETLQPSSPFPNSPTSLPLSWSPALSELDYFSPTEHLHADDEDHDPLKFDRADSLFDEPLFPIDSLDEGEDAVLDENDDVEDEEMDDVDEIADIFANLDDTARRRANEMDVCYMTNFAPDMLGRWAGGSA